MTKGVKLPKCICSRLAWTLAVHVIEHSVRIVVSGRSIPKHNMPSILVMKSRHYMLPANHIMTQCDDWKCTFPILKHNMPTTYFHVATVIIHS